MARHLQRPLDHLLHLAVDAVNLSPRVAQPALRAPTRKALCVNNRLTDNA